MSSPVRVLLADDQALVRDGFRSILDREADLDVVGEAADGVEALELTRRLHPDVVLMDIRMPRLDGLEATRRLLTRPAPPRVLVLTTFDRNDWVYEALRAGASGFLLKDVPREQLVAAVRMVARGDATLAPSLITRLVDRFVNEPPPATGVPDSLGSLSARELEVFGHLARGASNAEIAGVLFLGEATVKTHVARILAKLALRDRVQAVVLAYESGYLRPGRG